MEKLCGVDRKKPCISRTILSLCTLPGAWWKGVGKKRRPDLVQPIAVCMEAESLFLLKHHLSPGD